MGRLAIHAVTVSVDFGDKSFGNGNGRFMSASSRVPDGCEVPIDEADEIVQDGVDLYFAAWQTMLQTRYATGEISLKDFKELTAGFLVRVQKIASIYKQLKDVPTDQLEAYLERKSGKPEEK